MGGGEELTWRNAVGSGAAEDGTGCGRVETARANVAERSSAIILSALLRRK